MPATCAGRTVASSAVRQISSKSSGGGANAQTVVLLLHDGEPRTLFYARKFLEDRTAQRLSVPGIVSRALWTVGWPFFEGSARLCVDSVARRDSPVEKRLERIAERLSVAVNELVPEHGPLSVRTAFASDSPTIEERISSILSTSSSTSRLILLPSYPHFHCSRTGSLLERATTALSSGSKPQMLSGRVDATKRVVDRRALPLHVSTLDRWHALPAVTELWRDRLEAALKPRTPGARPPYEAVLFVAPNLRRRESTEYKRAVWATCEELAELADVKVPWKTAFYGPWTSLVSEKLEICESIPTRIKELRAQDIGRILLVPVTQLWSDVDTHSILPRYLSQQTDVALLAPPLDAPNDEGERLESSLVHGFAEAIRSQLEGRRADPRLSNKCRFCSRFACKTARDILVEK